jgi:phage shock protein A
MQQDTHSIQSIRVPVETVSSEELIQRLITENNELRQALNFKDALIDELTNTVAALKELVQELRDEIAVLKGQKPKPKIAASLLEGSKKKSANGMQDSNGDLRKKS